MRKKYGNGRNGEKACDKRENPIQMEFLYPAILFPIHFMVNQTNEDSQNNVFCGIFSKPKLDW